MRSSHTLVRMETTFDEPNLVPHAGLIAPAALAQQPGVAELVDEHVRLPDDAAGRANVGSKAMTVIGAMLAGGDCIDDVDVLRAGAAGEVFDQVRAPSTIGTWLRGFIWATVGMLDKVSRRVLARAWQAGLGPDLDPDLTVDFDSTICRVFGTAKQGARFGYTEVRGYHRTAERCLRRRRDSGSTRGDVSGLVVLVTRRTRAAPSRICRPSTQRAAGSARRARNPAQFGP